MEELYKVMDDLLEVEFQMKAGMDILKELEELSMKLHRTSYVWKQRGRTKHRKWMS